MPKFFVEKEQIQENSIFITGEDAHHIQKVLRCREGEEVVLCDKEGTDYLCEYTRFEKDKVEAKIKESFPCDVEPKVHITLFQGLPKAEKMEWIIQKCVELGISSIVPVTTQRCVVKLNQKEEKKLQRWSKIAESAAKQSGRGRIPSIGRVLTFSQAIEEASKMDGGIIPYEKEMDGGIRQFVKSFQGKSIGIFIGPEGGFTTEEVLQAQDSGIVSVSLGKRILRTETAGMVATALLLYELE